MEDMSMLLWTKLYRFVGTETQVYLRRRYALLYDFTLNTHTDVTSICSGSKAEGLHLPGSDTDLMFVVKSITVLPTSYTSSQHCHLCMETNNIKPGFARLRVVDRIPFVLYDLFISPSVIEMNDNMYVSSLSFHNNTFNLLREGTPQTFLRHHGPCASGTELAGGEYDYLYCLHCPIWPNEASEWIHRHRPNNWPSTQIEEQVVAKGCLLVPIGNPLSSISHMEWRLSFSVVEKMLFYSMNHTQLLCYGLLKLYLKHVIHANEEVNGLLCSYFLKTCLFYSIEEEHISWSNSNLVKCFWTCFKRLYVWVRQGYCPNYFIKENKMFTGKIHGDNQRKLLRHLTTLYEQGLDAFIQIPCLADLVNNTAITRNSRTFGHAIQLYSIGELEHEFLCDKEYLTLVCDEFGFNGRRYMLLEYLMSRPIIPQADEIFIASAYFCSKITLSQRVYLIKVLPRVGNKEKLKRIKKLKQFIHSFKHGDICTGLLQNATLCYNLGQYNKLIHILLQVLSKISDITVFNGLSMRLRSKSAYITEVCGRGLTVADKRRHYDAFSYVCVPECEMYPPEIKTEIVRYSYKGAAFIPPAVYCNILLFLTYNAMGYIGHRSSTLHALAVAAHDEVFTDDLERPLSIALLEKCIEIVNSN